jgi:hypothetical protein
MDESQRYHAIVAIAYGLRHALGKRTKTAVAHAAGTSRQLVHKLLPEVYGLAEANGIELPELESRR